MSESVKRWDLDSEGIGCVDFGMYARQEGPYVLYSDYAALKADFDDLDGASVVGLMKENEELKAENELLHHVAEGLNVADSKVDAAEASRGRWKRYAKSLNDWHANDDQNKPVDTSRLNEVLAAEEDLRVHGELD